MAAIDTLHTASSSSAISNAFIDFIKRELWVWIEANQDLDVFTVRIWVVRKTFKVRDLDPVFELLLGARP